MNSTDHSHANLGAEIDQDSEGEGVVGILGEVAQGQNEIFGLMTNVFGLDLGQIQLIGHVISRGYGICNRKIRTNICHKLTL